LLKSWFPALVKVLLAAPAAIEKTSSTIARTAARPAEKMRKFRYFIRGAYARAPDGAAQSAAKSREEVQKARFITE
jgi:hypothetical protein